MCVWNTHRLRTVLFNYGNVAYGGLKTENPRAPEEQRKGYQLLLWCRWVLVVSNGMQPCKYFPMSKSLLYIEN